MTLISTAQKLLMRADDYQKKADALRLAAAELEGTHVETKQRGLSGALAGAIQLRAQQRGQSTNGHGTYISTSRKPRNGPQDRPGARGQDIEGRRAIILGIVDDGQPHKLVEMAQALQAAGHQIKRDRVRQFMYDFMPEVRAVGNGAKAVWRLTTSRKSTARKPHWTKRAKEFSAITKRGTPRKLMTGASKHSTNKILAQRKASAKILAKFSTTEPRPVPPRMNGRRLAVYVQRGYLVREGEGFIRTNKPFSLELARSTAAVNA